MFGSIVEIFSRNMCKQAVFIQRSSDGSNRRFKVHQMLDIARDHERMLARKTSDFILLFLTQSWWCTASRFVFHTVILSESTNPLFDCAPTVLDQEINQLRFEV